MNEADFINHVTYLALQGLSWEDARKELRENFNLDARYSRNARRIFLAAARQAA